jgi:hypothetical protein
VEQSGKDKMKTVHEKQDWNEEDGGHGAGGFFPVIWDERFNMIISQAGGCTGSSSADKHGLFAAWFLMMGCVLIGGSGSLRGAGVTTLD